jgi:hypothetical protein
MPELINWPLLRDPVNWIIVALMVAIAAFGLHLLLEPHDGLQMATGTTGPGSDL